MGAKQGWLPALPMSGGPRPGRRRRPAGGGGQAECRAGWRRRLEARGRVCVGGSEAPPASDAPLPPLLHGPSDGPRSPRSQGDAGQNTLYVEPASAWPSLPNPGLGERGTPGPVMAGRWVLSATGLSGQDWPPPHPHPAAPSPPASWPPSSAPWMLGSPSLQLSLAHRPPLCPHSPSYRL